jgi:hypothetical protein
MQLARARAQGERAVVGCDGAARPVRCPKELAASDIALAIAHVRCGFRKESTARVLVTQKYRQLHAEVRMAQESEEQALETAFSVATAIEARQSTAHVRAAAHAGVVAAGASLEVCRQRRGEQEARIALAEAEARRRLAQAAHDDIASAAAEEAVATAQVPRDSSLPPPLPAHPPPPAHRQPRCRAEYGCG